MGEVWQQRMWWWVCLLPVTALLVGSAAGEVTPDTHELVVAAGAGAATLADMQPNVTSVVLLSLRRRSDGELVTFSGIPRGHASTRVLHVMIKSADDQVFFHLHPADFGQVAQDATAWPLEVRIPYAAEYVVAASWHVKLAGSEGRAGSMKMVTRTAWTRVQLGGAGSNGSGWPGNEDSGYRGGDEGSGQQQHAMVRASRWRSVETDPKDPNRYVDAIQRPQRHAATNAVGPDIVRWTLTAPVTVRAGECTPLLFAAHDGSSGVLLPDVRPYLNEIAHFFHTNSNGKVAMHTHASEEPRPEPLDAPDGGSPCDYDPEREELPSAYYGNVYTYVRFPEAGRYDIIGQVRYRTFLNVFWFDVQVDGPVQQGSGGADNSGAGAGAGAGAGRDDDDNNNDDDDGDDGAGGTSWPVVLGLLVLVGGIGAVAFAWFYRRHLSQRKPHARLGDSDDNDDDDEPETLNTDVFPLADDQHAV